MNFLIINSSLETIPLTNEIKSFLTKRGHTIEHFVENIKEIDYVISIGGDGTLLRAAHYANEIPILGINMGRKGFLAEVEKDNVEKTLEKVLNKDYKIKIYPFIEASCNEYIDYAMNDVTIYRSNVGKTLSLSILVNDKFIYNFMGDGIIISTAAGSTAYNLSVGGPICLHDCGSLLITPIAAHSLTAKTVVVSDRSEIKIVVNPDISYPCKEIITCDGNEGKISLKSNDVVTIKRTEKIANFIYFEDNNIFDVMKRKLM